LSRGLVSKAPLSSSIGRLSRTVTGGNSSQSGIINGVTRLRTLKIHLHHRRLGDPLSYAGN